jgi:hypothetical protein
MLSTEQIDHELALKGWKKMNDEEYEQHQDGWEPFYLHYNVDSKEWKLKRFGLGMNISAFEVLDEESLVSIFRLCSQFAKKSPW